LNAIFKVVKRNFFITFGAWVSFHTAILQSCKFTENLARTVVLYSSCQLDRCRRLRHGIRSAVDGNTGGGGCVPPGGGARRRHDPGRRLVHRLARAHTANQQLTLREMHYTTR